ncbi:hypothetical protein PCE1_000668 [Barthelona sp. PCE]
MPRLSAPTTRWSIANGKISVLNGPSGPLFFSDMKASSNWTTARASRVINCPVSIEIPEGATSLVPCDDSFLVMDGNSSIHRFPFKNTGEPPQSVPPGLQSKVQGVFLDSSYFVGFTKRYIYLQCLKTQDEHTLYSLDQQPLYSSSFQDIWMMSAFRMIFVTHKHGTIVITFPEGDPVINGEVSVSIEENDFLCMPCVNVKNAYVESVPRTSDFSKNGIVILRGDDRLRFSLHVPPRQTVFVDNMMIRNGEVESCCLLIQSLITGLFIWRKPSDGPVESKRIDFPPGPLFSVAQSVLEIGTQFTSRFVSVVTPYMRIHDVIPVDGRAFQFEHPNGMVCVMNNYLKGVRGLLPQQLLFDFENNVLLIAQDKIQYFHTLSYNNHVLQCEDYVVDVSVGLGVTKRCFPGHKNSCICDDILFTTKEDTVWSHGNVIGNLFDEDGPVTIRSMAVNRKYVVCCAFGMIYVLVRDPENPFKITGMFFEEYVTGDSPVIGPNPFDEDVFVLYNYAFRIDPVAQRIQRFRSRCDGVFVAENMTVCFGFVPAISYLRDDDTGLYIERIPIKCDGVGNAIPFRRKETPKNSFHLLMAEGYNLMLHTFTVNEDEKCMDRGEDEYLCDIRQYLSELREIRSVCQ